VRRLPEGCCSVALAFLASAATAHAQVTRLVIDARTTPAFDGATYGDAGQYETIAGRAYGEIDPSDPRNAIITDIRLAPKNAHGKVEYMATFFLVKPIDLTRSSHLLWHDVPNRGGRITIVPAERALGDIGLSSGWQGDHSGGTSPGASNEYAEVPVAHQADGSAVTGPVMARIVNASGPASHPLTVYRNAMPYRPLSLDPSNATLTTHASETSDGRVGAAHRIASTDWAWARCSAEHPFPGTPDSTQICIRGGFNPTLLYQLVFTARDPNVLGIGFAAYRDVADFFRNAAADADGNQNPLRGQVSWVIGRGYSQSGNFLRAFMELGFTQNRAGVRVHDGMWPIIAGRRISLNTRFALPDGALTLYEPGSEGPQWWTPWPDRVRGLPARGILGRCSATRTCPKIFDLSGSAEVWDLKLTPGWVGTSADRDIPLPANVRRYYVPGTAHGGGAGGFSTAPLAAPACPAADYGTGSLAANPVPYTESVNALRLHLRNWVMKDIAPPPSQWPRLSDHTLVAATKQAMGFPTIPGLPTNAPTGLINPLLDYDWGRGFDYVDGSGVPHQMPPTVKRSIPMTAPAVDADGNELGGIPVVLRDAPLGTYLGWNVTASGFHRGKICAFAGGMIPFARTRVERLASGDPRSSLEERYGTHDGYVRAVRAAAAKAVSSGFLLDVDATRLIDQAARSDVLKP
jgi:hypothetical protein